MFEEIVAKKLTKILGKYIKDLDAKQLKVGIWNGYVMLRNFELKSDALDELNLPVYVKHGIVGQLELVLPWKKLGSQSVVVIVEDLCFLCTTQTKVVYDKETAEAKELAEKKAALEEYELAQKMKKQGKEQKEDKTFVKEQTEKIFNNFRVYIRHVHVRYEGDSELNPGNMYAVGATIESIAMVSTDVFWRPRFQKEFKDRLCNKLVELTNFAVYVDVNAHSLSGLPTSVFCKKMCEMIAYSGWGPIATDLSSRTKTTTASSSAAADPRVQISDCYVLTPMSGTLKFILNMTSKIDVSVPKLQLELEFPEMSLKMNQDQYHTVMELVDSMGQFSQRMKYIKLRPHVLVERRPRAWFYYAACAIRQKVRHQHQQVDLSHFMKRKRQCEHYVALYKRTLGAAWLKPLSETETSVLKKQEEKLSYEDVVFFRTITDKVLLREAMNLARRIEFLKNKKALSRGRFRRWLSGVFGHKKEPAPITGSEPKVELSTQQMDEVYGTVGYNKCEDVTKPPPDYVFVKASVIIKSGELSYCGQKSTDDSTSLIKCSLAGVSAECAVHPNSIQVGVQMQSLGSAPLFQLRVKLAGIADKNELLEAFEKGLECCENERCKAEKKASIPIERNEKKKEMSDRNRLQSHTHTHTHNIQMIC